MSILSHGRRLSPLLAALVVAGASAASAQQFTPGIPAEPAAGATVQDQGVLYRELTRGVYEVRHNPHDGLLYVASALSAPGVHGGVIYRLNPETLEPVGAIHTDRRNFALAFSPDGRRLFTTNSIEHSLTAIDLEENTVLGRLDFDETGTDGYKYGPRQVVYDANRDALYVGAVGNPAVIWVVDPQTLQLRHTIRDAGKWVTGLMVHPRTGDLYAANGSGEILVIDTETYAIEHRFRPAGDEEALLLNMALDEQTNRLYVTDHSGLKTTLIVNPDTGERIGELPEVGDSMAILFSPERREIYISNREQGTVTIWDADTSALERTIRAAPNPNSLALSADGAFLYATIKTPFTDTYLASGTESVIRIPLDVAEEEAAEATSE